MTCSHKSEGIFNRRCNVCGVDLDEEEIRAMTPEQVDWELRAEGIDPEAVVARIKARVADALGEGT